MPQRLLWRYLVVGGLAYVCEMGTLLLLRRGLELSPVRSVAISFWVGFVVAFILQKHVTFQNRDNRPSQIGYQLLGYSLLTLWNYLFTLVFVALLNNWLSVFGARTLAILIITSWNFIIYRVIFKTRAGDAKKT